MDETMVYRHNKVVSPNSKVYFLGDVTCAYKPAAIAKQLEILHRMNGEKVLIKGNHDIGRLEDYARYFKDVRSVHQFEGIILSHIPIHPGSLARWGLSVHGHTHNNKVLIEGTKHPDPRYACVSMEQIDYTPISLEDVKKRIKK